MTNKLLETSLKIAKERILLKNENTQFYPQWSIKEAVLNGALPNGYIIHQFEICPLRKVDPV